MKAGLGSAALRMPNGLVVAAIVAVNAVGDIIDPDTGTVVAGVRKPDGTLRRRAHAAAQRALMQRRAAAPRAGENTTIGVVATNARLTKAEVSRMALMARRRLCARDLPVAHAGRRRHGVLARDRPMERHADVSLIGALAADAMAEAVVRAVTQATGLPNIPAVRDLKK